MAGAHPEAADLMAKIADTVPDFVLACEGALTEKPEARRAQADAADDAGLQVGRPPADARFVALDWGGG